MTYYAAVTYLRGGKMSNWRHQQHTEQRGIRLGTGSRVLGHDPVRDRPAHGR